MTPMSKPSNRSSIHPREAVLWDWDGAAEERIQGVTITKARGLRGREMVEARLSIRLAMMSALTRNVKVKAVGVVKAALVEVLGKRR